MVEEMVRRAKAQRDTRSVVAFFLGCIGGACLFSSVETGFFSGLLVAGVVWIWESHEVARVTKIQKPWRDE